MVQALTSLADQPARFDRSSFRAKFARQSIMKPMAEDILTLGAPAG